MNIQEEKRILLCGIDKLLSEMTNEKYNLDIIERYHNLVNCLMELNWRECGLRQGEGSHNQGGTNEVS
jgi:hypothetical protein